MAGVLCAARGHRAARRFARRLAAELRGPPTLLVGSGPPDDSGSPVHSPFKSCGDDDAGLGLGQVTDSTLERQTYPPVPWPRRRGQLNDDAQVHACAFALVSELDQT